MWVRPRNGKLNMYRKTMIKRQIWDYHGLPGELPFVPGKPIFDYIFDCQKTRFLVNNSSKLIKQNSDAKSNSGMVNTKGITMTHLLYLQFRPWKSHEWWEFSWRREDAGGSNVTISGVDLLFTCPKEYGDHSKFGLATKLCSPQT